MQFRFLFHLDVIPACFSGNPGSIHMDSRIKDFWNDVVAQAEFMQFVIQHVLAGIQALVTWIPDLKISGMTF